MHSAKVAAQIRVQIRRFSGEVSGGLPETAARLVREVIYGVQSRGSVRLSEIARALEEKIRLKKVMARLSRQLNRPGLRQRVRENLLKLAAPRVGAETLLVVDLTDVIKPYVKVSRLRGRFISAVYVGLGCHTPSVVGEQDFLPLNVNGHRTYQGFGH